MSHHCHGGSCSHDHHHGHDHSHCNDSSCCSCHHCDCGCHHEEKYSDTLLDLADEAWMEILKEKIKEEIRLMSGDNLTEMAKLVATSNHARWQDKMEQKKDVEDFEGRLHELLYNRSTGKSKK